MRATIAAAIVFAPMLAGCGGSSRTVTVATTTTTAAATSTTTATSPAQAPVSPSVISRAEYSIVDAACTTTAHSGVQTSELGTAFAIVPGNASVIITASHVAGLCLGGSMGANDAMVAITHDDATHDIAVLQETDGGPPVVPRALGPDKGP
jgi:hypothetical protein